MNAKKIHRYFEIYREYILDNNLEDDSDLITIDSLIAFVEDEIIPYLDDPDYIKFNY